MKISLVEDKNVRKYSVLGGRFNNIYLEYHTESSQDFEHVSSEFSYNRRECLALPLIIGCLAEARFYAVERNSIDYF